MTMTVSSATPWDTTSTDATTNTSSTARTKNRRASDTPSGSALNAFASTLASMLAPALPFDPTSTDADASSDLDAVDGAQARENGANGAISANATNAANSSATLDAGSDASADALSTESNGSNATGATATGVTATGVTATGTDPRPAYAAAADARATANTAPITDVNAGAEALNPQFRARLNRVITRMHDELGHDVQIVEGYRPQSRQDYLFAQGRTRSGPVVTWTKSSKHTLGMAADLKIDGSYGNPAAYQQLARIAAQEGLHTLGSRDPGHVELPSRGGAAAWGAATASTPLDANVSRALEIALSSDASNTGDIGSTASDTDGINGLLSRATRGSAAPAPGAVPYGGANAGFGSSLGGGMQNGQSGFGSQRDGQSNAQRDSLRDSIRGTRTDAASPVQPGQVASVASVADVASVAQVAQVAQVAMPGASAHPGVHQATHAAAADVMPAPAGALSAARVGHLLDVRDATPATPLSHVTLDLDNASGGSDRITVQLRSGAVDTSIALGDSTRADKVSLRVGELQHALEQHGLETGAITVAQSGTDNSAGWTPRQGGDQSGADQRQTPNYRDHRQDADDARQRSRREQQGGRQQ